MSALKVFTNGCFDILHAGHIYLFKYLKGENRPFKFPTHKG